MVIVNTKLKDIPRKEIDALENLLDRILTKTGRSECSGREWSDAEKSKLFADIRLAYEQGAVKEVVRIDAEGISQEGNFEVQLKINLPDESYSILMKNLEQEAPIISRGLPKSSYSFS